MAKDHSNETEETQRAGDKLTPAEIDARREAGLKNLLAMPPKPHSESTKKRHPPKDQELTKLPKGGKATGARGKGPRRSGAK